MAESTSQVIDSDTLLSNIDNNFRVFAGPGAGKTHWLARHLVNVLRKENKLTASSRIACISYTNVASEIIRDKFYKECQSTKVQFSTIHGFLYANAVKPYAHFLTDDQGHNIIDLAKMDGHDEHVASYTKVVEWAKSSSNTHYLLSDIKAAQECLETISWRLDGTNPILVIDKRIALSKKFGSEKIHFPSSEEKYQDIYLNYKRLYWKDGTIHHDDVLYFSYILLQKYEVLRLFLSFRFPYVFVDEFQDTNPFQAQIISWLSQNGTTVGVIGDLAQSIYGFQGATPGLFRTFGGGTYDEYIMEANRRSTNKIVCMLNCTRKDIRQSTVRDTEGEPPIIVIGNQHAENIRKIKSLLSDRRTLTILARKNDLVAQIRGGLPTRESIWEGMFELDVYKARFLEKIIISLVHGKNAKYDQAISELMKIFKKKGDSLREPLKGTYKSKLFYTGLSIEFIQMLLPLAENAMDKRMNDLYNKDIWGFLKENGIGISQTKSGKTHRFLESHTLKQFIGSIKAREDSGTIRTIHNAKGDEFENVCVCLEGERDLGFIINADLIGETEAAEECRVRYVAMSRAKDFLALSLLELKEDYEKRLKEMGFIICRQTLPH